MYNQPPTSDVQMQAPGAIPIQMGGPLAQLQSAAGIYVKQKVEALEAIIGLEGKNSYKVYLSDANGEKIGEPIFKAKEESSCLCRICCPGNMRSYKMKLKSEENKQVLATGQRDFKCTFLCCNRPEIILYDGEGGEEGGKVLGKIIHQFSCCNVVMEIQDASFQPKFFIEASLCQLGLCCKEWPCSPCQTAEFKVKDADKNELSSMTKKSSGCCKAMFTDVSYFSLIFPQAATLPDRVLLLMATLLIDYSYFEENPMNESNQVNF